jgi:hypothetical protein
MGSSYLWGINPIQDVLLRTIMLDADISDVDMKGELNNIFTYILEQYMKDRGDLVYLNFDISKDDLHFKLVANNILTALWLSGVIPENSKAVLAKNECYVKNRKYTFDEKTKILKYEITKNG